MKTGFFEWDKTTELFLAFRHLDQGKPLDDISVFKMLLDDLRNIIGLDLTVPDAFGIDEDGDADRAKADRAAIRQNDLAHRISAFFLFALAQAFGFENAFKLGFDFARSDL